MDNIVENTFKYSNYMGKNGLNLSYAKLNIAMIKFPSL